MKARKWMVVVLALAVVFMFAAPAQAKSLSNTANEEINANWRFIQDTTISGATALIFEDNSGATVEIEKTDGGWLKLTPSSATYGLYMPSGNIKLGNGTPTVAQNGDDLYVKGNLEVDGTFYHDGAGTFASTVTIDDGNTNSPLLKFVDGTDATASFQLTSGGFLTLTSSSATTGLNIQVGCFKNGNGTPDVTLNAEDMYNEGTFENDGAARFDGAVTMGDAAADVITITGSVGADLTLDDGSGASPSLILKDVSDETATFSKVDSGYITLTTLAADGFNVLVGNLKVGAGTPDQALGGTDAYITDGLEVDGATRLDGAVTVNGNTDIGNAATDTLTIAAVIDDDVTLDDAVANSPLLIFTDSGDATCGFQKALAGPLNLTASVATSGLKIGVGNLWIGAGTAGTAAMNGDDLLVSGQSEFDGTAQFDGAVTAASTLAVTGATTLTGLLTANGSVAVGNAEADFVTVTAQIAPFSGANSLSFSGATDDAYQTLFAITDPTSSDKTITFPNATGAVLLSTDGVAGTADAIYGATGGKLVFEGSTNDANETSLDAVDPNHAQTVYLPLVDASAYSTQAGYLVASFGARDAANSFWGDANAIVMEGATGGADANELTITLADPTADRTITFPDQTGAVILSAAGVANTADAIWAMSGAFVFEGTTANDNEVTLGGGDPKQDAAVTLPGWTGDLMAVLETDYTHTQATANTAQGYTLTVPDAVFSAGKTVRITLDGTVASSAAGSQADLKVYQNSTVEITHSMGATGNGDFRWVVEVTSTGNDSQEVASTVLQSGKSVIMDRDVGAIGYTDTVADTIAVTWNIEGAAGCTVDVYRLSVEYLP